MKIDDSILLARDFDIFFLHEVCGKFRPVHCATFGSLLPEDLNDDDYIAYCAGEVAASPIFLPEQEIEIMTDNVNHILGLNTQEDLMNNEERRGAYIRTFVNMARKGFWSYDRYHHPHSEPNREEDRFILISYPKLKGDFYPRLRVCNCMTLIDDYKAIVK
ncbi:MAG: hypothetical protein K2H22_04740 [Muribaculaceae bacterium]|nr:hypothetical protein [Muribaculaceae bacterium]